MKRLALAGLAAAALVGFSTAANAKTDCGKLPYSTQVTDAGIEAGAQVSSVAKGLLGKLGTNPSGMLGAEYVTGAIAASDLDAARAVLDHYACWSRNALEEGHATQPQVEAFEKRYDLLASMLDDVQDALTMAAAGTKASDAVIQAKTKARTDVMAGVTNELTSATAKIASDPINVDPHQFTQVGQVQFYAKVKNDAVAYGACGGVVVNVLEQSKPNLQAVLSMTPDLYKIVLGASPTSAGGQVRGFLTSLAAELALVGNQVPTNVQLNPEFKNCTQQLLQGTSNAQGTSNNTGASTTVASTNSGTSHGAASQPSAAQH